MAFVNKFGNILKQTVSKHIRVDLSAASPSIYQAIRCMSSSKLFVGGLSYNTDDPSLRDAFANYGEVIEARVILDRETGRSRGFGFVSFTSSEEASAALAAMDGKDLHGRIVRVNYATDRSGGFRGGGGGYGGGGYGGGGYSGGYGGSGGSYGGGGGGYGGGGGGYGGGGGAPPGGDYGSSGGDGYGGGSYNSGGGAPPASSYGGAADGGAFGGGSYGGGSDNFRGSTGSSFNAGFSGDGQDSLNGGFGNSGQDVTEGKFRDHDDEPNDYVNRQA